MTTLAIVQSAYIPWKGYFDLIRNTDQFVLYDCVQYTTRDWRNRNRIKTADGLHWLTIPVHATRQHRICDVTCADKNWPVLHWKTLCHAYARAPYFSVYADTIHHIYKSCPSTSLTEINHHFLKHLCALLEIDTPLAPLYKALGVEGDRTDQLIAVCRQYGATTYLSGPSAKAYLEKEKFHAAGIEVKWMEYHYTEYPQIHPPFEHAVSVLDLLFNTGAKHARYF